MKRFLLPILCWFLTATAFAQIPNAGFENWNNEPVLLDWTTNSYPLTLPAWDPYIVKQDTDQYSGNYAANFYANGQFKAFASTTFEVVYHPVSLNARVKYNFAPCVNDNGYPDQDTISIDVELLNGTVVVDKGHWEYNSPGFLANYQQITVPITQNVVVFDSCRITIHGGKIFGGCGIIAAPTQFKVDHLELKYSAVTTCIDSAQICLPTCGCFGIYDPVCGCDGKTYSNSCEAYISGVTSWNTGACQVCIDTSVINLNVQCPFIYDPVCGCDGSTYVNSCVAYNHNGVTSWTAGPCQATCVDSNVINPSLCPAVYDPVCGCDGKTYPNDCVAYNYGGVTGWTPGACQANAGTCNAGFAFSKHIDSVWFYNSSTAPTILSYAWTFGDGATDTVANPAHVYAQDGTYHVCLWLSSLDSLGQPCLDSTCTTIVITHSCIDTTIIDCDNPALCCDFVPQILVCGCDSVTYNNACEAEQMYGVTQYYPGSCVTGLNDKTGLLKSVSVYPNPATDKCVVNFDLLSVSDVTVRVLSIIGETLFVSDKASAGEGRHTVTIPVAQLSTGVYLLQVEVNARAAAVRKLIKE